MAEIPPGANLVGTRFVMTIKNAATDNEAYKGKLVAQGCHDR
eukprot:CAMPEP_0184754928 /NCGR_PEP_ID=MMETSP0315-20130426/44882_1 /TAXON_ID=101924 /ORGANISM="Rhodosorus marinus, Strain UTEX LB 2760" /LENGTH=41 /DNA_ID= /DNA_START= /DNA_END= /DNA_ORIENTATION=